MDRIAARLDKLRKILRGQKIEALLVSSVTNVRYLTGFTGDDSALLLSRDRAVLVSDGRYETQIRQECPGLDAHIRPIGQLLPGAIACASGKMGKNSLGFESAVLTVADLEDLRAELPTVELLGRRGLVESLRAVKDREEVAEIRQAIDHAERAFGMLRNGLRAGQTEKEVADDLEAFLRRCGASAASFPPIVAVGPRAALPHARPTPDARIGDSDFVLIDWGATARAYKSDLTRVLVTGKVTPKFEKVYQTVLAAQERGIAAIRPGALARDVDAEARSVIEDAGFGRFFGHGLGHGIGMDIHESPRLRSGSDLALQAGMVITVEPGIYLPDWGGVRIEDDVLVTHDGHEVLTRVPKGLDSVRPA